MQQHFDSELNYTLVRSPRRKRLALQVKAGELFVRATPYCQQRQIDAFIRLKLGWIKHQLHEQQQLLQQLETDPERDGLRLLDQPVPVQMLQASQSGFAFDGKQLLLYSGSRVQPERQWQSYQQQIKLWYQQEARRWIEPRLQYWQQHMQLHCSRFYLKAWKRRWGCCSNKGELGINWQLIKAPGWVIDYVLVHELAHLQWMDHSPAFWQLVRSHYPEVNAARAWLKRHQLQLLA